MTQTLAPADVSHYYQRPAELSTLPFWQLPDSTDPAGPERGHAWSWHDILPALTRSREIVDEAAAFQRRALILRNPGLAPPAVGATPTLAASYQMLFPGETAPVHAHSISALRFGLAGRGARMIIDGDRVPMEPGDLILTPGWSWHGHVHPGGDQLVVWLDGLDVPFVMGLRAGFYRNDPHAANPLPTQDTPGTALSPAALAPADAGAGRHSPVRRYPWQEAYPALQRLMARARGVLQQLDVSVRLPSCRGRQIISAPRRIGCSVSAAALLVRSTTHAESATCLDRRGEPGHRPGHRDAGGGDRRVRHGERDDAGNAGGGDGGAVAAGHRPAHPDRSASACARPRAEH
jgi:hypothetical protein